MMKRVLILLTMIFASMSAQAMEFNPEKELFCALDMDNNADRYRDIQKFYILEARADGLRDIKVGAEAPAENACMTADTSVSCLYDEFEIHVDLSTVIEYSMNGSEGYRVLGMAKKDWAFETSLTCYQGIY